MTRVVYSLVFGFLAALAAYVTPVFAGVTVSEVQRFIWTNSEPVSIKAGHRHVIEIPVDRGTKVEIDIYVRNKTYDDITAWLCDSLNYQIYKNGGYGRCAGIDRGKRHLSFFDTARESGSYYLILDNGFSLLLTKKTLVSIALTKKLDRNQREEIHRGLDNVRAHFLSTFDVNEFDISLRPCGQKNAFSETQGGHITLCSELFFDLIAKKRAGALEAIFYHELAHTLLNLWGLPNWANEETADEFAMVMLLWNGRQEMAIDWLEFYEDCDSWAEAEHMIENGDSHPLSVQRQRNIKQILANPEQVTARWNKLLYPFFTDPALQTVLDNPGRFHDRDLARQELETR